MANKKTNETKTVTELRSELCTKVSELNKLYAEDKPKSDIDKAKAEAKELLSSLNTLLGKKELQRLRNTSNPLLEAVKSYSYSVQKLVEKTDKDTGDTTMSIDTAQKQINLRALNDFVDGGIGIESGWTYRISDFARVIAAKTAADVGADWQRLAKTFKIKAKAERTQVKDPTSMKSKIELLQAIVDTMYFEPFVGKDGVADETKNAIKIKNEDINYIQLASTGKGRTKLSVKTAHGTNDSMVFLVMDVLYHHITGTPYSVEYKAKEEE